MRTKFLAMYLNTVQVVVHKRRPKWVGSTICIMFFISVSCLLAKIGGEALAKTILEIR